MIRNQEAARWDIANAFQQEMRGRTVGLWGYGGIGRETARIPADRPAKSTCLTRGGVRPRRDVYLIPGTGDPDGVMPHRVFGPGQEARVPFGLGLSRRGHAADQGATDGLIGEKELRAPPADGFHSQSGARADHPGGGAAARPARGLDRRRRARHPLLLSAPSRAPPLEVSQRHHYSPHLRFRPQRAFSRKILGPIGPESGAALRPAARCSTSLPPDGIGRELR